MSAAGEGLQRPDLATGDGVTNPPTRGKTWTHLQNLRDAQQITAILVDPKDPNRVFRRPPRDILTAPTPSAAFFAPPTADNRSRKFSTRMKTPRRRSCLRSHKSADDLCRVVGRARCALGSSQWRIDLYRRQRTFQIHRCGSTWRPLTKGLPTAAEELGRMGIAVAPSQPNRLYASIEAKRGVAGIYRSDDAGESWKQVNSDGRIGGRGPGAMGIAVASDNPEVIYVAKHTTWKSTDAGKNILGFQRRAGRR